MGVDDGVVKGVTKIYDNGSTADRFNLVLVAEGFQEHELSVFADDCEHFIAGLFATNPFDEFRCAFNIFRLDVASHESGADDPTKCGGTGATPKTYFDAKFCNQGVRRALVANSALVHDVVLNSVPAFHSAQVIVNSSIYGGTGGAVGVSSHATKKDDGTPVDWREILLHEMGHSIFHLADEYEYLQGCDVSEPDKNHYPGGEPTEENLTISPTAAGKWNDLLTTNLLPTTSNPDCTKCDIQPNPVGPNDVGTFEGADHYHCGVYRPQYDCKMRKLDDPFCAVCARVIRETLAPYDPPGYCPRDPVNIDWGKWVIVATTLFGVIQDGGGVIIVGGKPIPIDPWGPLRHSLWAALADPKRAPVAVRDLLTAVAIKELTGLLSRSDNQVKLSETTEALLADLAPELDKQTIR